MQPGKANSVDALIDAAVRGELDEAKTLRLCKQCPELVTLALLAAAKRIAERDARILEHEARIIEQNTRKGGISLAPVLSTSRCRS